MPVEINQNFLKGGKMKERARKKIVKWLFFTMISVVFVVVVTILIPELLKKGNVRVIVPVKVVIDEEYRARDNWKEEIEGLLGKASETFQKEFGISFEPTEFIEWESSYIDYEQLEKLVGGTEEGKKAFYDYAKTIWILEELKKEIPHENELVILFTGEDLQKSQHGALGSNYVVIWADSQNPRNVLLHEFGHAFGAVHPGEKWGEDYRKKYPSVMDPKQTLNCDTFDPKNRKIIIKTKRKYFFSSR